MILFILLGLLIIWFGYKALISIKTTYKNNPEAGYFTGYVCLGIGCFIIYETIKQMN